MEYFSSGTGFIAVGGCSGYFFEIARHQKFQVGAILYKKNAAIKGKFEKVVIKKIRFSKKDDAEMSVCKICNFSPLYIDTLNAYHNEEDLLTLDETIEIIDAYNTTLRAEIERLAMNCSRG